MLQVRYLFTLFFVSLCNVPSPYLSIQTAINDPSCTEIVIPAGTYYENLSITNLSRDLTIEGAGKGLTFIDGSGAGSVVSVMVVEGGAKLELRNLTIQNGNSAFRGGGIYRSGGAGTTALINARVRDNWAEDDGGGVFGSVTILDSEIINNHSGIEGGGVAGASIIRNSIIMGNHTQGRGGGVYLNVGEISGSTVISNTALNGGGIYHRPDLGPFTISDSEITNNVSQDSGGGIVTGGLIQNSRIAYNEAENGGGVTCIGCTIETSTIEHNEASNSGGGIDIPPPNSLEDFPYSSISFSTIRFNESNLGGGLRGNNDVYLENVTISHNSARDGAGAVIIGFDFFYASHWSFVTIADNNVLSPTGVAFYTNAMMNVHHTIVANNDGGLDCQLNSSLAHNQFNMDSDGSCGFEYTADPLLEPFADNGGPTETRALGTGSPAIDAGAPQGSDLCPSVERLDQREYFRSVGACDLGAYEVGAGNGFYISNTTPDGQSTEAQFHRYASVNLLHSEPVTYTVDVVTVDGSAIAGEDYVPYEETLVFPPGTTTVDIRLNIIRDNVPEEDERYFLKLQNSTAPGGIAYPWKRVLIYNDDPNNVSFESEEMTISETDGTYILKVESPLPVEGSALVKNFELSNGTATGGEDFVIGIGTFTIPVGQQTAQFQLSVIDDALIEGLEWFEATLSNGGAPTGEIETMRIYIEDDETVPTSVDMAQFSTTTPSNSMLLIVLIVMSISTPIAVGFFNKRQQKLDCGN